MTIAPPDFWSGPLPAAAPPEDMALHRLPTGTYRTRAAFAVTGGAFRDVREFAATAVLISHPGGDLLIDAGFGAGVAEHVRMLARFERAPFTLGRTAAQQLEDVGHDRARLRGVLVTHTHWDHVSGLDSLRVPIWITGEERRYAATDSHGAVFRSVSKGLEMHEYGFDGPAHLGFPASSDVHGDGSVVVVPAGGHTHGSVVVFVTLPTGERYAFIGDLTWQSEGITRGAQRPWLMRRVADVDAATVRLGLQRVVALSRVMRIVPAHDLHAYDSIPLLATRQTRAGA
ncbi:MBL fold metallo-hydrolase [Nakamurella flavida]|uniref:MBL fold metallo-hydrolase n=1 Tax=Nakamurella flavida TaxID=363630 RepID=A0A939C209_9ACTN|nr:MBL fold metallo-hydrolase [Nakamurella flavida]MBM9475561.1 MBL fold metallo-hydrolase [Nakamurella flavida]MDP9778164.1 glyoxylase-like metal-dependent hydrolase (beta-lactamase superfamily II) [Nakamurella flavida]